MAMTMYNPAHPGEIFREYLGTVQVGVAAKKLPWRGQRIRVF